MAIVWAGREPVSDADLVHELGGDQIGHFIDLVKDTHCFNGKTVRRIVTQTNIIFLQDDQEVINVPYHRKTLSLIHTEKGETLWDIFCHVKKDGPCLGMFTLQRGTVDYAADQIRALYWTYFDATKVELFSSVNLQRMLPKNGTRSPFQIGMNGDQAKMIFGALRKQLEQKTDEECKRHPDMVNIQAWVSFFEETNTEGWSTDIVNYINYLSLRSKMWNL
jgi:hypothetical protein